MTLKLTRKQIYTYKGRPTDALYYVCKDLDTRISALDGAGEIEQSMIENADTAGNILVANASKVFADVAMSGDITIATTGATTIGAKKVTAAKTAIADGKVFIGGADGAAAEQSISGDATLANTGALTVANDAIGAAKLKVVERNITIAGGAASGTVTNAADIDGVILGVIPYAACESPIKDVTFTTETGAIQVELMSAQGAEVPATVTAVVLQA